MVKDINIEEVVIEKIPDSVSCLGNSLLSYVLDLPEEDICTLVSSGGSISYDRKTVIDFLQESNERIISDRAGREKIDLEWHELRGYQDWIIPDSDSHVFNFLRFTSSKVENVKPTYADPIISAFYDLALEAYPVTLLPSQKDKNGLCPPYYPLKPSFFKSHLMDEFISSVKQDRVIMSIFPDKDNDMSFSDMIYSSSGSGSGIQLCMFFDMLFTKAYSLMRIYNKHSLEDLMKSAEKILNIIRKVISNKKVLVPCVIGIRGVQVKEELEMPFADGVLMNIHDGISDIALNAPKDKDMLIYITDVPYTINIIKNTDPKLPPGVSAFSKTDYDLENIVNNICLSFSLQSTEEKIIPVCESFRIPLDPLVQGAGFSYKPSYQRGNFIHQELSISEIEDISSRFVEISKVNDFKIYLAKKRLQTSLMDRLDYSDSFIDAIIGLENLFGTKSEISLSISSSVSKLLGNEQEKRKIIFDDVKRLYNLRSRIIHGDLDITTLDNIKGDTDKAIMYLIGALKELYIKDNGRLLNLKPSARVKSIILD